MNKSVLTILKNVLSNCIEHFLSVNSSIDMTIKGDYQVSFVS